MPADGGHLGQKKISTQYWNTNANPFRTLPKDAPTRGKDQARSTPTTSSYSERGNYSNNNSSFRGRGGFNGGRGGMNQGNYNRNFNNNMGYNNNNNNMVGGFQGPPANNFAFNNRGNMMGGGMRGGPGMRGGRGGNMMGMNPMGMGGMGMGMPGNMGMGMMGGPNGMAGTDTLSLHVVSVLSALLVVHILPFYTSVEGSPVERLHPFLRGPSGYVSETRSSDVALCPAPAKPTKNTD